jgi:hypothetical protein
MLEMKENLYVNPRTKEQSLTFPQQRKSCALWGTPVIPAMVKCRIARLWYRLTWAKKQGPVSEITRAKRVGGMAQAQSLESINPKK